MKFVWEDEVDIGYYTCYLYDDSGKELQNIYFRDHTTDHNIKFDQENGYERYSAYETGYCHGWSSHECIDCDEDYYKHFDENGKRLFGFRGTKTHTVEDVKRWCEEFIASLYITHYDVEYYRNGVRICVLGQQHPFYEALGFHRDSSDPFLMTYHQRAKNKERER